MRKTMKKLFVVVYCMGFFSLGARAHETDVMQKALQAIQSQDFQTAVDICRGQLESDPDNYEFNFLLSRAYAYSREYEKSLNSLDRMLEIYPQNLDLLLFRSRVLAWKGAWEEGDAGFAEVLSLEPENKDALIGRAEIASWKKEFADARGQYQKILLAFPDDPDIHFRIGRVYLWEGNYADARIYFKKACKLDPSNIEYQKALKNAHPEFSHNFELRYQYQNEGFNDGRGNYNDHHVVFGIKISPWIGSLYLKYGQTERFDERDSQYGIELYPHLWPKAYGYIDINFSPGGAHFPKTSYLFEVYQSLLKAAEVSIGYRRMIFENKEVPVYLGSVGYYAGNFYPFFRWYYTPEDEGNSFSWIVNVRRYFTKDNYMALGYGQGSRPFDIITIEDVFVQKSWILMAEWDWILLKNIRLKVHFSHRNEKDGPVRNTFFVATGYRW